MAVVMLVANMQDTEGNVSVCVCARTCLLMELKDAAHKCRFVTF